MNPVSVDIKDMLVAESSVALIFATDLFIARIPAEPDNAVTLYDIGGRVASTLSKSESDYYYSPFEVRIRNKSFITGMALADSILSFLHGRAGETWNGTYYSVIKCTTLPFMLEWDDNNRCIIIINFEAQRR